MSTISTVACLIDWVITKLYHDVFARADDDTLI
jgi:hypothetical protein